ncbi:GTPase HflX [Bdellovibrio sp. qaytius]|nr:GTPase HflX [Bdellovibrio sp. qaytius]
MDKPVKSAVLVGIQLPKVSTAELEASLQELTRLVTTLGYNVVGQVTQKRSNDRTVTVLGDGKLKELAQWTNGTGVVASVVDVKISKAKQKWLDDKEEPNETEATSDNESEESENEEANNLIPEEKRNSAQVVIVDTELSPSQIRNLESAVGCTVFDRTGVIIEIFSRHAKTKTARLQVEIARLTYLGPRLRETGGGEDREGGGGKGVGESAIELDKRKVRDRIKELRTELEAIGNQHQVRRNRRDQEISVALVGYTNAGKSSLMRAMTGSEIYVADKLFATLDTTIRPIYPETRPKVLLSDTVGFIKKLPHDLVASFKSTLDEALNASLLLFVVDSSDASFRSQLEVTKTTLSEVGADEIPSLLVLNKRDNLSAEEAAALMVEFPDAIMISTRDKDDLKRMREKIMSYFETDMVDEDIFIPYTVQGIIGEIRSKIRVLSESYNENGVTLRVRSPEKVLEQIKKKLIPPPRTR